MTILSEESEPIENKKIKKQPFALYALGLSVLAYYLWGFHKEHTLQYWPLGLFLLCPIMHFFSHGRHGNHNSSGT